MQAQTNPIVGKTITGVIAKSSAARGLDTVWMLQFSDGSFYEFVSPKALQGLRGKRPPFALGSHVKEENLQAQLAFRAA